MKMGEGIVSDFQKKKASGMMATDLPIIDEKDKKHQIMMEIEPLLIASGYRTLRNSLLDHGEYPCHCLAQTFWYPKRVNLVLVWDARELFSMGLPNRAQNVSMFVFSAMLAVKWLKANVGTHN